MAPLFRFDTNSPYAYLAALRVDAVLGPGVVWQPIALAFLLSAQGRRPWSFDEPSRSEGQAVIAERAAARGVPEVVYPPGWPVESYSLEPVRAVQAARELGREREVALALFRRNFELGSGLGEPGAVRSAWVEAGLDDAGYEEALAAAKGPLTAATNAAIEEGVYGVPTVTVDGRHFFGDDQLEAAASAITGSSTDTDRTR